MTIIDTNDILSSGKQFIKPTNRPQAKEPIMRIVVVDDQIKDIGVTAQIEGDAQLVPVLVKWDNNPFEDSVTKTHPSVWEAAKDILSHSPDVIFLDHNLGSYVEGKWGFPTTGEDVAYALRAQGFKGRLVGFSSDKNAQSSYCDVCAGKGFKKPLSWYLQFCTPEVEKTTLATEVSSKS
jgi:CheY-like chemotaxis protein